MEDKILGCRSPSIYDPLKYDPTKEKFEPLPKTLEQILSESQAAVFISAINRMMREVHENADKKGFWPENSNDGEKIALIHSELSEALEACRKPGEKDKHCPDFLNFDIELADAVIRIFDLAFKKRVNLAEAILAKHNYNLTREHKHGKQF